MPGSMETNGTDELIAMLDSLATNTNDIAGQALYEGAKVVADAYRASVNSVLTNKRHHKEPGGRLPTPEEKESLKQIGIAHFEVDGLEVNTLVGPAEGYMRVNGKVKAIKLLARSINSGTNFMRKQPVFRRASTGSRRLAQDAMVAKAEELINNEIAK